MMEVEKFPVDKVEKQHFIKVFTGEAYAKMIINEGLTWNETSLIYRMLHFMDYETNIVLSPVGLRKNFKYPATINEIHEYICNGKKKKIVIDTLNSLEAKGFITKKDRGEGNKKYVVISYNVALKGKGEKKAAEEHSGIK